MVPRWKFLRNEAKEDEGLADAGIETFRDEPFAGLARECGQNSIDAASSSGRGGPKHVVVRFFKETVMTETIPDILALRKTIDACLERAEEREDNNEINFFERARGIINAKKIDLLRVSDEGTTGLVGPCKAGTPYHALIKSKGVSKKENRTSGGSFGIGKNAAYAVSALRTVFYSTVYEDKFGSHEFLAQGKSILVSHRSEHGEDFGATGYWGEEEGFMPVSVDYEIPAWLRRTELGTTVTAVGFLSDEEWDWRIAESLVRNFFSAIHNGKVVFEVGESLAIHKESLVDIFNDKKLKSVSAKRGSQEELEFSYNLYKCLTSPESVSHEQEFNGLGRVRLSILVGDKLEKQVGLIRNGMYITSSFRHFKEKLARFPLLKDFIAVVEPVDADASANIRLLENPRHDELSPERVENAQLREILKEAVNDMNIWVRAKIKNHTALPADDEVQLDDLNEFFSAPEDNTDRIQGSEDGDTDPFSIKLKPHRRSPNTGSSAVDGKEGGRGGEKPGGEGGVTSGPGNGAGKGEGVGPRGGMVPIKGFRNFILGNNSKMRKLIFTPEVSGKARLRVLASGIAGSEDLFVCSAPGHLVTSNGALEVALKSGERMAISIDFGESYDGPIEISLSLREGEDNEN